MLEERFNKAKDIKNQIISLEDDLDKINKIKSTDAEFTIAFQCSKGGQVVFRDKYMLERITNDYEFEIRKRITQLETEFEAL